MPIDYTVSADLFDGCPCVRVVCPRHLSQTLMEWCWTDRDPDQTWVRNGHGFAQEYVGYQPTKEERASAEKIGLEFAVAPADANDRPHFRLHLQCPHRGCTYHWQGRIETFKTAVTPLLPWLVETKTLVYTITDMDEHLRRVGRYFPPRPLE